MVGVQIDHADETELQAEPQELDQDPEQEIALETHFAHDGIAPQSRVNAGVAPQLFFEIGKGLRSCFHPPTAEYLRMPRCQTKRASR